MNSTIQIGSNVSLVMNDGTGDYGEYGEKASIVFFEAPETANLQTLNSQGIHTVVYETNGATSSFTLEEADVSDILK